MPISAAAVRAAAKAGSGSFARASSATARTSSSLRAASAAVSALPHSWTGVRLAIFAKASRFRRRSFAYSGMRSRIVFMACVDRSGDLERLLALLPVARAELARLQRVEHAQHLVRVAADASIGHGDEADEPLRV